MAKPKISWEIRNYGIYKEWDKDARDLPEILKFSEKIPARVGIEFGYIVNIRKARGKKIRYTIEHPPFTDEDGEIMPPFTGEMYVRSNDWDFFLGDSIWEPVADKMGPWRLITELDGTVIGDRTFTIVADSDEFPQYKGV